MEHLGLVGPLALQLDANEKTRNSTQALRKFIQCVLITFTSHMTSVIDL